MVTVTSFRFLFLLIFVWNLAEALIAPTFSSPKQHGLFGKRTRLEMSVLSPFDTATSGLASIARLPFGTNVVPSGNRGNLIDTFIIKMLYDTEESNDCRSVRERITELDLNVEVVVPATPNSRTFKDQTYQYYLKNTSPKEIPRMIIEDEGSEEVLVGSDAILKLLDSKFGTRDPILDPEDNEVKLKAVNALVAAGTYLPAFLRFGRGGSVDSCAVSRNTPRPSKPVILYSYEGNQFCRLVREVLTELDIPYELRSVGKGSPRREELAALTGGSTQCPYFMDPNTGTNLPESKDIIEYLYKNYASFTPPDKLLGFASKEILPIFKPLFTILAPLQAGSYKEDKTEYEASLKAAISEIRSETKSEKVVVYTYQLSPFCMECLEVLVNLGIKYQEISLGLEWTPFLIAEGGAIKRTALGELTGQTSLPHVFINGESVGGLYDGLVPALEDGSFWDIYRKDATKITDSVEEFIVVGETGQFE